jgi:hypothetical protein
MKPSFRLDQHPRRWPQPLSAPPAGYFEQLPTRVMAQVATPARQPLLAAWLRQAPAYVRTSLASTLLLGTFAASFWLGAGPTQSPSAITSLDGIPREELVDYLASDARLDLTDLAELPARPLGITNRYLHPSAPELTDAFDAQPTDEAALL